MSKDVIRSVLLPAVIVIVGFAAILALSTRVESARPELPPGLADTDLDLHGGRLKGFAFGFEGLIADWYYIRSLQYIGDKLLAHSGDINIDDLSSLNPRLLFPLLDNATDLDPNFSAAYIYGAVVLPAIDRQKAVELGEKGIGNNPRNWRLFQHLGYTYWRMGDYEKAARTFDADSAIPGAEPFLRLMSAAMRTKGGSHETARLMYREMYASTDDEQIRTSAERRLWELDWLEEQAIIDRLLEETMQKEGRCAASLKAITPTLARGVVPPRDFRLDRTGNLVDPSGAPYVLNQADCRVELDWQTSKVPRQ